MLDPSSIRRVALAGALALSLTGLFAEVEGVEAMPVTPGLAQVSGAGAPTTIRYYHRRHGRAGLYRCGPGALSTHLQRKACGIIGPSREFLHR